MRERWRQEHVCQSCCHCGWHMRFANDALRWRARQLHCTSYRLPLALGRGPVAWLLATRPLQALGERHPGNCAIGRAVPRRHETLGSHHPSNALAEPLSISFGPRQGTEVSIIAPMAMCRIWHYGPSVRRHGLPRPALLEAVKQTKLPKYDRAGTFGRFTMLARRCVLLLASVAS